MAGFRLLIGANTVELTRSLGELQKDLSAFKKQLQTATSTQDIIKLNAAIAQTDRQIKGLTGAQSIGALNTNLRQLPAGANQATTSLTNLGRVVSDAPFGFIAISNNIEPLIQSFVYLKQQSGSTTGAIKAMGSSLLGGGGLVLAFSLATSALTFFSQQSASAKREMEGFAKAQSDSNKQAGEEIANLKVLAAVAANTSNSINDRKEATEELQKALKANNVQLSQEEILNNKAAKAIDIATNAILARAKARAVENRIAELSGQNLDREFQRSELNKKLISEQDKLNQLRAAGSKVAGAPAGNSAALGLQQVFVQSLTDQIKELDTETTKATAEIDTLLTKVTQAPGGGGDKVTDLLKQRIDALKTLQSEAGLTRDQLILLTQLEIKLIERDSVKLGFTKEEVQQRIQATIDKAFPGESLTSRFKIRAIGEIDFSEVKLAETASDIDVSGALGLDKIDPAVFDPMIKKLQEAAQLKKELLNTAEAEKLSSFIVSTLTPAFNDLFNAVLDGGTNFLEAFRKLIGDIIKRLVVAVAQAAALAGILSLFGLPLGGVTGFKGIFGSLLGGFKFAEGGIAMRPTFGMFGEQGPEAVIPLSRLQMIMNPAQGGGGMGGEFKAKIVDGGRDLWIIMQRENRRAARLY